MDVLELLVIAGSSVGLASCCRAFYQERAAATVYFD
jgi:hypothetical protein